jgi:hypothetical protein
MTKAGMRLDWGVVHKRRNKLVSRQAMIEGPAPIDCVRPSCLIKYIIKSWRYVLVLLYHRYRTEYAEEYPDIDIPLKYRTGDYGPEGIWSSIWEIIKVKTRRLITWLKVKRQPTRVMENSAN